MPRGKRSDDQNYAGRPFDQEPVEGVDQPQVAVAEPGPESPSEVKPTEKKPKEKILRCVVCRRRTDLCECKDGPLTREAYKAAMGKGKGKEPSNVLQVEKTPQTVEDMARFLLYSWAQVGSWGSSLVARVPVKEADQVWAFTDSQIAEILPRSMRVVERYWDQFPAWMEFVAQHLDLFMLGKLLLEDSAMKIASIKMLRRSRMKVREVQAAHGKAAKPNGSASEPATPASSTPVEGMTQ